MSKKQLYLVIALIIAFGVAFEIIQEVKLEPRQKSPLSTILSELDVKPFVKKWVPASIAEKILPKSKLRSSRRARNLHAQNDTRLLQNDNLELGHPPQANKDGKKKKTKKELEAEKKKAAAKKKKEEEEKKNAAAKKKKDEEEKKKAEEAVAENEMDENAEEDETENADDPRVSESGTNNLPPVAQQETEEETPESQIIEEWTKKLEGIVNYKVLNEFIQLKQSNQITDAIFYTVVDTMIGVKEDRTIAAAYALNSVPSAQSFEKLVHIKYQAAFNSTLARYALGYINSYTDLSQLRTISAVVSTTQDPNVLREAAVVVRNSANKYLGDLAPLDDDEQVRSGGNSRYFGPVLRVLSEIQVDALEANAATAVSQAVATLIELLPEDVVAEAYDGESGPEVAGNL